METIAIKACEAYREREVLALYESVGWSAYYTRPELLREAFAASLCVYGAYHGESNHWPRSAAVASEKSAVVGSA